LSCVGVGVGVRSRQLISRIGCEVIDRVATVVCLVVARLKMRWDDDQKRKGEVESAFVQQETACRSEDRHPDATPSPMLAMLG
jgi:hypothetical protein